MTEGKIVSPSEVAKIFRREIKIHRDKKRCGEIIRELRPNGLDPLSGDEETEVLIAEFYPHFEIARKTWSQVRHYLERVKLETEQKKQGCPGKSGAKNVAETLTSDHPPQEPKVLLVGWYEISASLKMTHPEHSKIKSLNARYEGPIISRGQGTKPIVDRNELLDWWDLLTIKQNELANQQKGRNLSAQEQYCHGKTGVAAPQIGGGVKKRRRSKQTPAT